MNLPAVEHIIAAAGQPVGGPTLSMDEVERAVGEGRVLNVVVGSWMGESEAAVHFATRFGVHIGAGGRAQVPINYLVFPRPIPSDLRGPHRFEPHWEDVEDVYCSFGVPYVRSG